MGSEANTSEATQYEAYSGWVTPLLTDGRWGG